MAEKSNGIKYISFDLDGTLVDSLGVEVNFWQEIIPKIYSKEGICCTSFYYLVIRFYLDFYRIS